MAGGHRGGGSGKVSLMRQTWRLTVALGGGERRGFMRRHEGLRFFSRRAQFGLLQFEFLSGGTRHVF